MNAPDAPRRTLKGPAAVAGAGLFTGRPASIQILPAAPGSGISLRRADLAGSASFPATVGSLAAQPAGMPARNTILGPAGGTVMTVEHLISALAALGVTDAIIEVSGPEIPIADGSAEPFVRAINSAGVVDHGGPVAPLRVTEPVIVEAGAGRITARPRSEPGCSYTYELDYGPGAPIPPQTATITIGVPAAANEYATRVAPARTFCLQAEAEQMRAMGLFKNLSPKDMLVIGSDGPIDNAYRLSDEPARHKLLDLIGDLALAGRPLQLDIVASRAGHALNHALARALSALGPGLGPA